MTTTQHEPGVHSSTRATVAAGLSLIPPIAAPDDTATGAVLVGAHLLAAAIIIPTLSQRLTAVDEDR